MSVFSQSQYVPDTLSEMYTNPEPDKSAIVDFAAARNNGSAAARLDVHLVPNGGVADASNLFYSETLSPNDAADLSGIVGTDLGPNDAIWGLASVASTIVMRVTGRLR
jgi:hypothetical protein